MLLGLDENLKKQALVYIFGINFSFVLRPLPLSTFKFTARAQRSRICRCILGVYITQLAQVDYKRNIFIP